jgi:hypothetical protein
VLINAGSVIEIKTVRMFAVQQSIIMRGKHPIVALRLEDELFLLEATGLPSLENLREHILHVQAEALAVSIALSILIKSAETKERFTRIPVSIDLILRGKDTSH